MWPIGVDTEGAYRFCAKPQDRVADPKHDFRYCAEHFEKRKRKPEKLAPKGERKTIPPYWPPALYLSRGRGERMPELNLAA
jgi:hypothetical protein